MGRRDDDNEDDVGWVEGKNKGNEEVKTGSFIVNATQITLFQKSTSHDRENG